MPRSFFLIKVYPRSLVGEGSRSLQQRLDNWLLNQPKEAVYEDNGDVIIAYLEGT